jgi:hypothetical protein
MMYLDMPSPATVHYLVAKAPTESEWPHIQARLFEEARKRRMVTQSHETLGWQADRIAILLGY